MIDTGSAEKKRSELAGRPAGGMTVGELMDAMREIGRLDQEIRAARSRAAPASSAARFPAADGRRVRRAAAGRGTKISELAVGRYALTALAAGLCLLALCVFLSNYWARLPGVIQWGTLMIVGLGLWGLGHIRSGPVRMRPFWLGVAGLGAGWCYAVLMAGVLVWALYGPVFAACLASAWFVMGLWAGTRRNAWMFYIIAYLGGAMAVWLAGWISAGPPSPDGYGDGIVPAVSALLTAALGSAALFREKKPSLARCGLAYCLLCCAMLSRYDGIIPAAASAALCGWALYTIRHAGFGRLRNGVFCTAAVSCAAAIAARSVLEPYGTAGMLAALALVAACCVKCPAGYMAGTVAVSFRLLGSISYGLCGAACVLPAAAAACAVCAGYRYADRFEPRLALRALYMLAALSALDGPCGGDAAAYLVTLFLLALGYAGWLFQATARDLWDRRDLEVLGAYSVPAIWLYILANCGMLPYGAAAAGFLGLVQLYSVQADRNARYGAAEAARTALYVLAYPLLMSRALFRGYLGSLLPDGGTGTWEMLAITAALAWTAAYHIRNALVREERLPSVLACASANWHLFVLTELWSLGAYAIGLDVAGILLSAGSVALGFRFDRPALRKTGLGCAMLYGLKLGLLDAMSAGSGAVPGLLLAGALCFAMAAGYNAMGRKFAGSDTAD